MTTRAHPERRLVIAADLERYGRQNNLAQHRSQQVFQWAMAEAARTVGLSRSDWSTQPSGDGELAVLPALTPEPLVVSQFAPALDRLLREHNLDLRPDAGSRMRVAMHVGLVHLDGANGFPGTAVVTVCRLVNASVLRRALASCPSAAVALIVSDVVYRDIVVNGYDGMRPDHFVRTTVDLPEKDFSAVGWVSVPGEDVGWLAEAEAEAGADAEPAPVPEPRAAPAAQADRSTFSFNNVQMHGPTAIGDQSRAWSGPREA